LPPSGPAAYPAEAPAYPLQLGPVFVERVWGREDLSFLYPERPAEPRRVGEVWLTGERNRIANGPWAGVTLEEAARRNPQALLGTSIARTRPTHAPAFPLLAKFLFTTDKLSVQVHPTNTYAREREGSRGKTEMWHVLWTEPGARLAVGFREDLRQGPRWGQGDLRKAVESGEIEEMLGWTEVQAGDTFYVPAGTVHAIGPGIVLCEIQQNSDITYRFYDYKRPGVDGKLRPLHIEQALDVLKWRTPGGRTEPLEVNSESPEFGERQCLAACAYFTTEKLSVSSPVEHRGQGRVEVWIALEGEARFEAGGETAVCCRGEAVALPAALESVTIHSVSKAISPAVFLRTFPPEPETDILAPWVRQGFSEEQLRRVCFPPPSPLGKGRG
jgi:mannose-6-phosphate isomerase